MRLFCFLLDALHFIARFPAIGGQFVKIILHGLGPVIHQVLIHGVFVSELPVVIVFQQVFGNGCVFPFWVSGLCPIP